MSDPRIISLERAERIARKFDSNERRLHAENIADFLTREFPAREMLLAPILPRQGLMMLYSWRGVGKTYTALGIAFAVASGGAFLRWQAPSSGRVLYVDGEMPANVMQERLAGLVAASSRDLPTPDHFRLITPDQQEGGIPDLSSEEGREAVEDWLKDGVDLLVLDNLSTLCRTGKENEAEGWIPVQEWILSLRRRNIAVLLVHHAGKGGNQRGTSKREDVLDIVVSLKRPEDYQASEGARFEIHYEKARGLFGDEAKPFEAKLEVRGEVAIWTMRDLEDCLTDRVAELLGEGLSQRDIARELAIGVGTVNRHKKKAEEQGLLAKGSQ
jgi:putative DNA primase/helicase